MIGCLALFSSCGNDIPKCDNPEVVETVKSIILDWQQEEFTKAMGGNSKLAETGLKEMFGDDENKKIAVKEKMQLNNIVQSELNEELKSCGCESKLENIGLLDVYFQGRYLKNGEQIYYNIKTDTKGEILVEVITY